MLHIESKSLTKASLPIFAIGFTFGLFLSFTAFNGDDAGRVNLLYLLFVYLLVPLLSVVISLVSLCLGKPLNTAALTERLPFWTNAQKQFFQQLHLLKLQKLWFFYQSHSAALGFSLASMLTLLILLIITDVNFVWRSTLLSAEQLCRILTLVASPWWFWDSAQPSLQLLQQTQDSRLAVTYNSNLYYGNWWTFVFAVQFVYAFTLRTIMLLASRICLNRRLSTINKANAVNKTILNKHDSVTTHQSIQSRAEDSTSHVIPHHSGLVNWADFPDTVIENLRLTALARINATPLLLANGTTQSKQSQALLILVKAWEPPMGDLADFMADNKGLIFPINLSANNIVVPLPKHIQEWRRFVGPYQHWQVYQPDNVGSKDE